jgi:hypothetical protein
VRKQFNERGNEQQMDLTLPSTTVSIADDELDFKGVEQIFLETSKKLACMLMLEWLKIHEEKLFMKHDRSMLTNKGFKKRSILTLMGPVSFSRRLYRDKVSKRDRYLLDEAIGLSKKVCIAGQLAELGMRLATGSSYGKASCELEMLLGERVSKQAIWNLVQERGKKITAELSKERESVFANGETVASAVAETDGPLYGEADGCMISKQRGKGKKIEMKVGVLYKGSKRLPRQREEYALIGKRYHATMSNAGSFWEDMSLIAEKHYGRSSIDEVYVGGDGASWIIDGAQVLGPTRIKLDSFHIHRMLGRAFGWKNGVGTVVLELLKGEWDNPVKKLAKLAIEEHDEKRRRKQAQAIGFLDKYQLHLPRITYTTKEPGRLIRRQLGTMERHVDLVCADRFKKRGMSWSISGAQNLSTLRLQVLNNEWECPVKTAVPVTVIQTKESTLSHKTLPVHPVTMPIFVGPHQGRPWVKTLKTRITIGAA